VVFVRDSKGDLGDGMAGQASDRLRRLRLLNCEFVVEPGRVVAEILLRRWSKAKNGEGQVVLLSGEPGIGKSRLTAALLERLTPEPHMRLRYFCSPQHTDSPLYPIISQMERAARFTHADTEQVKLDKLDAVLALASTTP
jgi:predicted ATPase